MIDISKWHPAEQIVEIMTRIYNLGLTTPSGGNISVKDEEGNVWVTPSQIDKGQLKPTDVVRISPDGSFEGKHNPTSEYPFHLGIYKARPDIRAIVHSHPCALVAFSITACKTDFSQVPALLKNDSLIGFTSYCLPGSEDLANLVSEGFSQGYDAIIMENHGIITSGTSLLSAFHYLENLELLAEIQLTGRRIGNLRLLKEQKAINVGESLSRSSFVFSNQQAGAREWALSEELIETMKRAYSRKLNTATSACWSVRIDKNSFLMVPEGIDVNYLEATDVVRVMGDELQENMSIPVYQKLHQSIYNTHPEVKAICCAMPVSLMAFAVSDAKFDTRTIPESYIVLQNVPDLKFETFYNNIEEIENSITESSPCVILQNECFLVTGNSLFQVFDRVEVAEFTARSIIHALNLGTLNTISDYAINELKNTYLSD